MDIEDINFPNSWIPIRALREAADPRFSLRSNHRKTASSPPATPCRNFYKSTDKLSSVCTSANLHSRYNTGSIESLNPVFHPDSEPFNRPPQFSALIKRLNEEILILSTQLRQSNEVISHLTNKLNEVNKRHVIHLQALQERHEQKMRRNRQDFECFLKEITNNSGRSAEGDEGFRLSEVNKMLQDELENNNLDFQKQVNWLKQFCIKIVTEVKEKFDEDLIQVRLAYEEKIRKMKEKWRIGTALEDYSTLVENEDEAQEEQSHRFEYRERKSYAEAIKV